MDALAIGKAIVAGFDWGARTANIVSALWPDRCKGTVSVSGYLIGSREANRSPLPPQAELDWWYQYYFATDRGHASYDKYRYEFAKLIWRTASPQWRFDAATFDRTAKAFDNPDHVSLVMHNYRWRLGIAEGESSTTSSRRAGSGPDHRGAHDHARRRCQRCATSGSAVIRQEVRRQVRAQTGDGRCRSQPAAGSAAGLCQSCDRRRRMGKIAALTRARGTT